VESFGARLRREREQRKITLEDVSVSTKIGTRFLRALEDEHFEQLPGGIFNKGFVRAYARHLGIDEEQAIADYFAASGPPEPKLEEAPVLNVREPEPNPAVGQAPWGMLAVGLLLVALVFAGWGFYSRQKSVAPVVRIPVPVKVKTAAATAPSAELTNVSAPPVTTKENPPAENVVPGAQTPAPEPASNASASTPPGAATPSNPGPGSFVVLIKAREDSWISVVADGKQILQDTLQAPLEKAVEARTRIVIRTGNAGALDFSFNGKKLPVQGEYGEVKTLTFGADGLQPIPARTEPVSNN
jgi:cytoskeleton protein RodZ